VPSVLPRLLVVPEVAHWLSISSRRVEHLARDGKIPHIVLPDGELVFDADELARWLESLRGQRSIEGGDDAA